MIIVIAIMAILVGIVGTQVLPYINKSKESKDYQIINSYGTAATTAYTSAAEKITAETTITMYTEPSDANEKEVYNEIISLTGYKDLKALKDKMGSKKGKNITKIVITFCAEIQQIQIQPMQRQKQLLLRHIVQEMMQRVQKENSLILL